jgi:hypothetical protein
LYFTTRLPKSLEDSLAHHYWDLSKWQKIWWNAWLTISCRCISNMVRDKPFQVLLLVSIMLNIFALEEEMRDK